MATKFYEHYMSIAASINDEYEGLWDDETGFFYDVLRGDDGCIYIFVCV